MDKPLDIVQQLRNRREMVVWDQKRVTSEPDGLCEEAANEIERLQKQVEDAEIALNVWDHGQNSEYWLRHPK